MSFDLRKFDNFAPNLLGMFGTDVVLPGLNGGVPTIIRAVFPGRQEAVVNEYSNITYQEYVLRIPPDGLGTLAAEQVVTIDGRTYYVANVAPADLGWWVATLQDHS